MSEIGKYPFTQILIDGAYIYAVGLSVPYIKQCICTALPLNRGVNLLNSAVNLLCLCKVT